MKHGSIVTRLKNLDEQLTQGKTVMDDLINETLLVHPANQYAKLAVQVRGKRRYLHWRQRYYKRPFFKLSDDHGLFFLDNYSGNREQILIIEKKRILANFNYLATVYEYGQLLQVKNELSAWRNLRDEVGV